MKLVELAYFPTDVEQAKRQLLLGGFERPKDSLVRSVIDHLILSFLEGPAALKGRRQTATAIRSVFDLHPGLAEARVRKVLNAVCRRVPDQDLSLVFGLHSAFAQTWDLLEQDNRQRLIELLRRSGNEVLVGVLPIALAIDDLGGVCQDRIDGLDAERLGNVLKLTRHSRALQRGVDIIVRPEVGMRRTPIFSSNRTSFRRVE